MEFVEPLKTGFTVYSKSGCINCTKAKNLLKDKFLFFQVIDCDEYLIDFKQEFLETMKNKIGKSYSNFPMIFYDGRFIGGFNETNELVPKLLLEFTEMF